MAALHPKLTMRYPLLGRLAGFLIAGWLLSHAGVAYSDRTPASGQDTGVQQEPGPLAPPESRQIGQAPEDISRNLEELEKPKESLLDRAVIEPLVKRWDSATDRLRTRTGLDIAVAYTTLYQRLTDKKDGKDPREGAVGDLDIFGEWTLPGSEVQKSWHVGYQAETRHRLFTSSRPSELGASSGSLWCTTSGFNTQDLSLVQLWWQQTLFNDKLIYRLGKVDQADFFDIGTFKSANLFFSNFAFSDNPAIPSPDNGYGGAVSIHPSESWYLRAGVGDANGRKTSMSMKSFLEKNDYFSAAEVGLTPTIAGLGQGYYQFTVWHTDGERRRNARDQPSGKGFSLRFEQYLGENLLPFVSYSYSTGNTTAVRQLATAGIGVADILGYKDDIIGVAVGWGQPEDRSLRNQYVAEVFYRMQISDYFQLTPDIQVIREPSRNRNNDTIGVFGLRMRLVF